MTIVVIFFIIIMMIMFYMLNKIIDLSAKVSEYERKDGERFKDLCYHIGKNIKETFNVFDRICVVQENINSILNKNNIELKSAIVCPPVEVEDMVKPAITKSRKIKKYKRNKKSNNTNN